MSRWLCGVYVTSAGIDVGLILGAVDRLRAHISGNPVECVLHFALDQPEEVCGVLLSLHRRSDAERQQATAPHISKFSVLPFISTSYDPVIWRNGLGQRRAVFFQSILSVTSLNRSLAP